MRKLNAWLFMTLDGVVEAPEKWVLPDDEMFKEQAADYAASDALLLGRRTYDIFAAAWPQRGSDVPNADWMNETRKFVASTTLESPKWQNTTVLKGDVSAAVARLKQDQGGTITLNGSATFVALAVRGKAGRRAEALSASGGCEIGSPAVRHHWACPVLQTQRVTCVR